MKNILLSILIPVHNWDISLLLNTITHEILTAQLEKDIEVLIVDDCSICPDIIKKNKHLFENKKSQYKLFYFKLNRNIGRAAVRNLLASKADGDYLLFLDADVLPDSDNFLSMYLNYARNSINDIICGGISYKTRLMRDHVYDYYIYFSSMTDVKPVSQRNTFPWRYILTSNIMIRRNAFFNIPFNEKFTGYGYEDIEWGIRLFKSYKVIHIDNTVSHLGLKTKRECYENMKESIKNYFLLTNLHPDFFSQIPIHKLIVCFKLFHVYLLDLFVKILSILFLLNLPSQKINYYIFQFCKAVLLSRELKKSINREI
ncbi:MAG: glycosyltransferase family 2 protein [Eubacteriales bacterium]